MPVLAADFEDLSRLIGRKIPHEELVARVPMMGGAFDGRDEEGRLLFEFFPNRPDLLSVEGLARACRAFFDVEPGLKQYAVEGSDEEVIVDASVVKLRPYLGFARVDAVPMTDSLLAGLIEVQERLTTGPGRRRKKVAIGIHDAARVHGPFTYKAVRPTESPFVPLGMDRGLTPQEILTQHEKGRMFAHLVQGMPKVPLIVDKDDQVLSFPPVINGSLTELTEKTRNILVDVTGTDERAVACVLNIVATSLAERGGRLKTLRLRRASKQRTTPDLTPQATKLSHGRVRELLGLDVDAASLRAYLGRMGHDVEPGKGRSSLVRSPAYRMDILHQDDLVEDVGIGYGFDRFQPQLPKAAQFARLQPSTHRLRRARTLLLGMGFTEVVTLTVTGKRDVFQNLGAPEGPVVEVQNALSVDQAILRPYLFTSLLGILRANKHRELPQNIFEVGYAVPLRDASGPARNEMRACAVRSASRATFADCKSLVEAFLRDAGITATMGRGQPSGFIPGRAAVLEHEGRPVGFFGEVHPQALENFELGAPTIAFELAL